ncbi:ABC transporter substrate-binding protein [Gryllotalpicola reticulitermitis]|uniref:ABC transporter substrate-binding protein n=1 Tax=Gryllotalpicola reticulitermitis TaxID=1184153 RepID=A0ABV8Q0J3_9MICO
MSTTSSSAFTRRTFIGLAGAAGVGLLAGCTRNGAGSTGATRALKFWNMPWGNPQFNTLDKKITLDYKPASGLDSAQYQVIQWADWTTAFPTALASNTGPAVSSGGGTMAFQFAAEGKIAYADNLLDSWKKNGLYDDFLPGLVDTMKVDKGYAAVPYNLDMRVMWYNTTLLDKAGTTPPTDWDSYKAACAALKKIGVYGFGLGAASGSGVGYQVLLSFMINNGGGLFNAAHEPDVLTDANTEAMQFVLDCVKAGYVDPHTPSSTSANVLSQWQARKYGLGFDTAGLANNAGGTVGKELVVGSPLTGPSGKKGAVYFPNNIMMYTHTPSQKSSEAFMTYYYKHMAPLWTEHTGIGLPPLKSITNTAAFRQDANAVKAIEEWQPISKTMAAPGSDSLFYEVITVDGTPIMNTFAQSLYGGNTTVKAVLTKLQSDIESSIKALKH